MHVTAPPVGWPAARQFRDVNPTGRIPVLVLDDGRVIPESSVIIEFLEEQFADARALLPTNPHERAKSRLLARVADLYLMPPMVALARPEISGDRRRYLIRELLEGFATLDAFLEGGTYAVADQLSLADCALAPVLFAARVTGERLDLDVIKP